MRRWWERKGEKERSWRGREVVGERVKRRERWWERRWRERGRESCWERGRERWWERGRERMRERRWWERWRDAGGREGGRGGERQ